MEEALCCDSTKPPYPLLSPFGKVLSMGFYDGTTSGLAQCAHCNSVFVYHIIDWDSHQDRRIFALSRIAQSDFHHVVGLLSATEIPKWPFWWPRARAGYSGDDIENIKPQIDALYSSLQSSEYVIAADGYFEKIWAVAPLTESVRAKIVPIFDDLPGTDNFVFWKDYLQLSSDVPGAPDGEKETDGSF